MRSTLLFLAVLLACSPVQAHATAPPEQPIPPILTAWLTALLPATESTQETVAKRRKSAPPVEYPAEAAHQLSGIPVDLAPKPSATLLTHDSNAP
jgi:hypothetical protein